MLRVSPIFFTKEGYKKLLEDQQKLLEERKPAVEDLAKARAMGDLSENGYYKSARAKLSSIDHRLRQLKHQIHYAKVKESEGSEGIDIGSLVTLTDGTTIKIYTLVGEFEANPSEGKISHKSPLGRLLIGRKSGDKVTLKLESREVAYTIL